jgi:sugar/nucleoside kinase (ribokinase family)
MDVIVFGNVTLDIICQTVNDVPRYESISFDRVTVSPGGCGSNVAYGLAKLGVSTALVCRVGNDEAGMMVKNTWRKVGLDLRFLKVTKTHTTAVSVGLIDSAAQPRFIHTPGANAILNSKDIEIAKYSKIGAKILHIAGYFVLPGLLDGILAKKLMEARREGIFTSLDTVLSPRFWKPEFLWPCLSELDTFMCNQKEATRLTGEDTPEEAAEVLVNKGANTVIVKLGKEGCFIRDGIFRERIMAPIVDVVDTTGAGDAFAAGYLASINRGNTEIEAVIAGNASGSKMVSSFGAIGGWLD